MYVNIYKYIHICVHAYVFIYDFINEGLKQTRVYAKLNLKSLLCTLKHILRFTISVKYQSNLQLLEYTYTLRQFTSILRMH